MTPSIKGMLLTKLVDDVRALFERSEADRERLEACLSAGSLELLEGKVNIGRWYPIDQYTEISELIWREEAAAWNTCASGARRPCSGCWRRASTGRSTSRNTRTGVSARS